MNHLLSNRRGQQNLTISSLGTIAIGILVAVVMLGLGATILEKIKVTQTDATSSTVNQVLTWAGNNTPIAFLSDRVNTGSVTLYNNGSVVNKGGGVIGNYTVTSAAITIINTTGGASGDDSGSWITNDINATYNFKLGSSARNTTSFGIDGVMTMAEFVPTVAIIAVAAIVLGIVMIFFGRKKDV